MNNSIINTFDNFSPLKEIWLGDVYPVEFYQHLDSEFQDYLCRITEWTKEDLSIVEKKLHQLGVNVRRPRYSNRAEDYFSSPDGMLFKPEICPRDDFMTFSNLLMIFDRSKTNMQGDNFAWQYLLDEYSQDANSTIMYNDSKLQLTGANIVKLGYDLFVDNPIGFQGQTIEEITQEFNRYVPNLFPNHRCHFLSNGGHCDGVFTVLKPGHLLTTTYYKDYAEHFRNWESINIKSPEFEHHQQNGNNGKWWVPDLPMSPNFNNFVLEKAKNWIGNYTETFFEVNSLIVDEKNILVIGSNDSVFERLHAFGFNVHVLPFRTRSFWDGGLHCITLDINRDSQAINYFDCQNT